MTDNGAQHGGVGLGAVLNGRYRVDAAIDTDTGAFGVVYRAHDLKLQRDVAIKALREAQLDPDEARVFLARFKLEALGAANLEHANIIEIYDYNEPEPNDAPGVFFYVMRYIPGARSLATRLGELNGEPMPVPEAVACARQLAEALRVAHAQGIVHRDVKAANILVFTGPDGQPQVKLIDFGVAHLPRTELTATGAMMGTPSHWSPEYLAGGEVSPRADLWALGIVLYRCLTRRKPFPGTLDAVLAKNILERNPDRIREINPDVPVGLEHVVLKLLEKDPAHRYQDAASLADDLARYETLAAYELHPAPADPGGPSPLQRAMTVRGPALTSDVPDLGELSEFSGLAIPSAHAEDGDDKAVAHADEGAQEAVLAAEGDGRVGDGRGENDAPPAQELGDAGRYTRALADTANARLRALPRRTQAGLAVAGLVAGSLTLAYMLTPSSPGVTPSAPLVDAKVAQPKPKPVSPGDILRDRDAARQERLVAAGPAPGATGAGASVAQQPGPAAGEAARAAAESERRQAERSKPQQRDGAARSSSTGRRDASTRGVRNAASKRSMPARGTGQGPHATQVATPYAHEATPRLGQGPEEKDVDAVITFATAPAHPQGQSHRAQSALGIPPFETVPAQLSTAIAVSHQVPVAPAEAVLRQSLRYPDTGVVLPAGTRVVGKAQLDSRSRRVRITFSQIVLPNRSYRSVSAIAVMPGDGSVGLVPTVLRQDSRAAANAKEGLLDVAADTLRDLTGTRVFDRFEADERADIRAERGVNESMRLAASYELSVKFMEAL